MHADGINIVIITQKNPVTFHYAMIAQKKGVKMKVKIFESNKELDLSVLIDTRALICANSGGGKSYTARKIIEESFEKGIMSIVIDVEGEFRTLREKYDFLLIGQEGDINLSTRAAKLLPKKLMELNIPTIIDISELKKPERTKYVKEFLESLLELPREYWKPCLIFLDEIHTFAGQQEKQDSTWAVIDLATRGRKRGYCLIGCTQRIAKLHKDVVAELNNYGVGRTSLDIDMKRAAEILGFTTKEQMLSLRDLDDGEFFIFGPAFSKTIEKEKVARSKTTHPKRGQIINCKISSPNQKIKEALQKISDLPKDEESKIKESNDYKKEINDLKMQLRSIKPNEKEIKDAIMRGIQEAENRMKNDILGLRDKLSIITEEAGKILNRELKYTFSEKVTNQTNKPEIHKSQPEFYKDSDLNVCSKKIYSFLFNNHEREFTKSQVAAITGYSQTSGGFNNSLSQLNSKGLIQRINGNLRVKGNTMDPALTGDYDFSIKNMVKLLGKCERVIYEFLLENSSQKFTKAEISENAINEKGEKYSITSGGFNNALSRLNTLGLIKRENGSIFLNPELLEFS